MASTDHSQRYQEEFGQSHLARVTTQAVRRNLEVELDELKAAQEKVNASVVAGLDSLSNRLTQLEQALMNALKGTKQ